MLLDSSTPLFMVSIISGDRFSIGFPERRWAGIGVQFLYFSEDSRLTAFGRVLHYYFDAQNCYQMFFEQMALQNLVPIRISLHEVEIPFRTEVECNTDPQTAWIKPDQVGSIRKFSSNRHLITQGFHIVVGKLTWKNQIFHIFPICILNVGVVYWNEKLKWFTVSSRTWYANEMSYKGSPWIFGYVRFHSASPMEKSCVVTSSTYV